MPIVGSSAETAVPSSLPCSPVSIGIGRLIRSSSKSEAQSTQLSDVAWVSVAQMPLISIH